MSKALFHSILLLLWAGGMALAQAPPPSVPDAGPPPSATIAPHSGPLPMIGPGMPCPPGPEYAPPPPPNYGKDDFNAFRSAPPPFFNAFTKEDEHHDCFCWVGGEFLYYYVKRTEDTPLVTTRPTPGSPPVLSSAETQVLGSSISDDLDQHAGVRLSGGIAINCGCFREIEASIFLLAEQTGRAVIASTAGGSPILGRPFTNGQTGRADALPVATPGALSGNVVIENSRRFWGNEANAVFNLTHSAVYPSLDLLVGARYLDLDESLVVTQNSRLLTANALRFNGAALPSGSQLLLTDSFRTRNQFYGGQLGTRIECTKENLFLRIEAKVAVGVTHQARTVNGNTTLTSTTGATSRAGGGLLAVPNNIGRQTNDELTAIPEVGVNFGWYITPCLEIFFGYSFLYWDNVIRPGSEVDLTVNPVQVPASAAFRARTGATRPAVLFDQADFWAHGVNFGLAFRY